MNTDKIEDPVELMILAFKEMYRRNSTVSSSDLHALIKALTEVKESSSKMKERVIEEVISQFKKIVKDPNTVASFLKVNEEYLIKQKEDEFEKKFPIAKRNSFEEDVLYSFSRSLTKQRLCKVTDQEVATKSLEHKLAFLKKFHACISNYGLRYDTIQKRSDENQLFNIRIAFTEPRQKESKEVRVLVSRSDLEEHYVIPFNSGHQLMLNGKKIKHEWISRFQISSTKLKRDEVAAFLRKKGHSYNEKSLLSRQRLFNECDQVTEQFINTKQTLLKTNSSYLFEERLTELENITNPHFSLVKLIQLCKELNTAGKEDMRFAQAALLRAICDHVAPVFGKEFENFGHIVSNYRAEKNARSFKDAMLRLDQFLKPVSNSILHSQIRAKESLPTKEQLDFSRELDYLLQEVCRLLK